MEELLRGCGGAGRKGLSAVLAPTGKANVRSATQDCIAAVTQVKVLAHGFAVVKEDCLALVASTGG